MPKFILTIKIPEGMGTGEELKQLIDGVRFDRYMSIDGISGAIRDINGNTVGHYEVV